jgi:alcohol dehydrogenase
VDALVHALETAVTRKRTAVSQLFSREAFRLCFESLPKVLSNPSDLDARGAMLLGAAYAGMAIENSMLGCAHAAANPLTAHFGVVHGEAVGCLISGVIRRNATDPASAREYLSLAKSVGLGSVEALMDGVFEILSCAGFRRPLDLSGATDQVIAEMAGEASAQWTGTFNPVAFSVADFEALYREVLG